MIAIWLQKHYWLILGFSALAVLMADFFFLSIAPHNAPHKTLFFKGEIALFGFISLSLSLLFSHVARWILGRPATNRGDYYQQLRETPPLLEIAPQDWVKSQSEEQ